MVPQYVCVLPPRAGDKVTCAWFECENPTPQAWVRFQQRGTTTPYAVRRVRGADIAQICAVVRIAAELAGYATQPAPALVGDNAFTLCAPVVRAGVLSRRPQFPGLRAGCDLQLQLHVQARCVAISVYDVKNDRVLWFGDEHTRYVPWPQFLHGECVEIIAKTLAILAPDIVLSYCTPKSRVLRFGEAHLTLRCR
jgi:hypothetical protein